MVDLFSLIKDYLVDQEDGIRHLITWFLNLVMEEEALLQAGAQRYERTDSRKASRNGRITSYNVCYTKLLRYKRGPNADLNGRG